LNFFGFDLTTAAMRQGYFIVLEERLSEPRFGFDVPSQACPSEAASAFDLTWAHFQAPGCTPDASTGMQENEFFDDRVLVGALGSGWQQSSASVAKLALQRPVRIAMLANTLLGGECSAP
jgi:hypothetical protein